MILRQSTTFSPINKHEIISNVGLGYGVESGFDFYEDLLSNKLSKRYSWVIAQSNFLALECTKMVAYYIIYL